MQKTLKAPPKLTNEEKRILERFIWMADWHFDELIKSSCTELSSFIISWEMNNGKQEPIFARVYGLRAMKKGTKELCIANIFIRYNSQVFQVRDIAEAALIVRVLKKEYEYDEYMDRKWKLELEEKKKLEKQKSMQKGKLKKVEVVKKKAA